MNTSLLVRNILFNQVCALLGDGIGGAHNVSYESISERLWYR